MDIADKPPVPVISKQWVWDWRKEFGITWRTVNLRFKCSFATILHRLDLFFTNLFILRWLHFFLFPEGTLGFSDSDEKPLWKVTAATDKTFALKGTDKVAVNESHAGTRSRFTVKTRVVWPRVPNDGKDIAVLFKAAKGTSIRKDLEQMGVLDSAALLQFGPKGSYRTEHTIEYYKWLVPDAPADPAHCYCYLADWFSANLTDDVQDFFDERNTPYLLLPGLVTGHIQVNDTHAHGPYSAKYKKLESLDAEVQIRAGRAMPSYSNSTVYTRAHSSWKQLDHERISHGFVEVGIAGKLDGTDDGKISSDLAPFWYQLKMGEKREAIRIRIKDLVDTNVCTQLSDYKTLLVDYPASKFQREGHEAFQWALAGDGDEEGENDDFSDDGDVDGLDLAKYATDGEVDSDEGAEDATDDELLDAAIVGEAFGVSTPGPVAFGAVATTTAAVVGAIAVADAIASAIAPTSAGVEAIVAVGSPDSSTTMASAAIPLDCPHGCSHPMFCSICAPIAPNTAASSGAGASLESQSLEPVSGETDARASLWTEQDAKLLGANLSALETLRLEGGDRQTEGILEKRVKTLMKRQESSTDPRFVNLRIHSLQRAAGEAVTRRQTHHADDELRRLKIQEKLAQHAVALAKAQGLTNIAEVRTKELEAKERRKKVEAEKKELKAECALRQRHYTGRLGKRILKYWADHPGTAAGAKAECEKKIKASRVFRTVIAPPFWILDVNLATDICMKSLTWEIKPASSKLSVWASESFAWYIFGNKPQKESKNKDPRIALREFCKQTLPGYLQTLGQRYTLAESMLRHSNCVDLAYVEAVWRYSRLMGEKWFPPGIFTWPPPVNWKKGLALGVPEAGAASLGSSAVPAAGTTATTAAVAEASAAAEAIAVVDAIAVADAIAAVVPELAPEETAAVKAAPVKAKKKASSAKGKTKVADPST